MTSRTVHGDQEGAVNRAGVTVKESTPDTIEESVISPVIGREASPGIGPETKNIQPEDEQFSPRAVTLVKN